MNQQSFLWLWAHMTEEQRVRFLASARPMFEAIKRMNAWVDAYERAGVEAAEKHANGEGK